MLDNLALIVGTPTALLLVVVIVIGVIINKYLKENKQSMLEAVNNEKIRTYADLLLDVVDNTVVSLNQTMVDELKAKSEDGTLTEEEAMEVKEIAINKVLETFGSEGTVILSLAFDDLRDYVNTLIESAVKNAKKSTPVG